VIRLYHGTASLFDAPDLSLCKPYKDFGRGFYLSPDIAVARRMAERVAERSEDSGRARYVLVFEFDEKALPSLSVREFSNPINADFAQFVMANRMLRTKATDHNRDNRYDLVKGPIADDRMGVLFRRFEAGFVTLEQVIEELKFKKISLQYSFHTAKALSTLRFREAKSV